MRVVVCSLGGHAAHPLELPESTFADRPRIAGGERTLYELAVAARCAGFDVELRGLVSKPVLDEISLAAGGQDCAPAVGLPARRPAADDVVIIPEGYREPGWFAPAAFAPGRAVLMVLGPPGLFGWSFAGPPIDLDPVTVDPATVGTPEQFRAARGLGFELWTNSPGTAQACAEAAVECTFLGTGTPVPAPPSVDKTHDIAVVEVNKWAPLARQVAAGLGDLRCLSVPELHDATVAAALAPARILVWPSRIEGDSRIQREARSVGTVPVALRTNRFAAQLDRSSGAVVVDDVADIGPEVRRLLDHPDELAELSAAAVASARRQVDWGSYVSRVSAALHASALPPQRYALGELGATIAVALDAATARASSLDAERQRLEEALAVERSERAELETASAHLTAAVERLEAERTAAEQRHDAERSALELRLGSSVEATVAAEARAAELDGALQAYRARRIVRFVDRFLARPLRAVRLVRQR